MKRLLLISAALLVAAPVAASEYEAVMRDYLEASIRGWAHDPVLIDAITTQNQTSDSYSQTDIDSMDQTWRAEVGQVSQPMIADVLSNAASVFLRGQVEASGGIISEVFAMDARGLNVAASDVTSDYWQGDEAKFQETYPKGSDAVHFSEVEFDESANAYLGQVSIAITHPDSGEVIGALTIGLNAEALF